eukprot:CAMPEP_0181458254 /NCGR_PEP_ID=MMETSP1110-20121109/32215_1 /TAXON_ID=174948 /ORGANISM="Symbiodinium sp., Strain CCMP421" /LENGTH=181 /DNA_ID=CAMNT_0023582737 /DNA_START=755 /DNA_END=1298 /DNA_ORIENTATION=-
MTEQRGILGGRHATQFVAIAVLQKHIEGRPICICFWPVALEHDGVPLLLAELSSEDFRLHTMRLPGSAAEDGGSCPECGGVDEKECDEVALLPEARHSTQVTRRDAPGPGRELQEHLPSVVDDGQVPMRPAAAKASSIFAQLERGHVLRTVLDSTSGIPQRARSSSTCCQDARCQPKAKSA